jgi:hypothetical protein
MLYFLLLLIGFLKEKKRKKYARSNEQSDRYGTCGLQVHNEKQAEDSPLVIRTSRAFFRII